VGELTPEERRIIEAAQARRPTLILLDFLLPDFKGDDVCRALSANIGLAQVPIIVMSAKGEDIGECFADMPNVLNIITKPFSPEALLAQPSHCSGPLTMPSPQWGGAPQPFGSWQVARTSCLAGASSKMETPASSLTIRAASSALTTAASAPTLPVMLPPLQPPRQQLVVSTTMEAAKLARLARAISPRRSMVVVV